MGGRIVRPEQGAAMLELPEIGRLHIGKKQTGQNGREYPVSVDYFIPAGKYAGLFTDALGEKPQTIQIIFPDDSPEKVCNERYEYRDDKGALVARGDGRIFELWDGKKYAPYSVEQYYILHLMPHLMALKGKRKYSTFPVCYFQVRSYW